MTASCILLNGRARMYSMLRYDGTPYGVFAVGWHLSRLTFCGVPVQRNAESIIVKSKDNERYRCLLPKLEEEEQVE